MPLTSDGLMFLRPHQADPAQWEDCLAQCPQEIVYAHAWYLDIVCERWSAVVEVRDGRYVSLLPLPEKSRAGFRQVYQPFFTQQLGLFTTAGSRYTRLAEYLALIPAAYGRVYLQLQAASGWPGQAPGAGYRVQARQTFLLPLNQPYEKLYQAYSYNQKRNLKKGTGTYRVVAGDLARLIALFRESKGAAVPELKARHYATLGRLYQELHRRGQGQVLELWAGEQLLAAALLVYSARRVIYLFGASSALGRQQAAMAKLLDWVIRQEAGSGRVLDFEGSDRPALAKFYANFGAQSVPYLSIKRTCISFLPTWLSKKFSF